MVEPLARDGMIGTELGKNYRVVEKIGDGGMGVVYLVEHQTLRKQFAAKVLSSDLAQNAEARHRFEIEAHAASRLEHENIVNVTDYGVADDGRPYLVMELLRGKTLHQRMTEGLLPLEEIVAIIVPVCRGLDAAHEQGFIHRDIKPENIFLAQRSQGRFTVKVLDFGITKLRMDNAQNNRLTKMGQALGSPMYMAPEACKGDEVDTRIDIYSVGVLLYQLVTGELPFYDDNMLKILQMQVSQPVKPPRAIRPGISEELEAVILKALAKDPDQRYQMIEELEDALLAAVPPGTDVMLHGRRSTPLPMNVVTTPSGSTFTVPPSRPSGHPIQTAVTPSPEPKSRRGLLIALLLLLIAGVGVAIVVINKSKHEGAKTVAAKEAEPTHKMPASATEPTKPPPDDTAAGSGAGSGDAPAAPTTVQLVVKTKPAGAQVTLDGKVLGTTPLDMPIPSRSEHGTLAISAKGYKTVEKQIAGDANSELSFELDAIERRQTPATNTTTATIKKKPPPGGGSATSTGQPGPNSKNGNNGGNDDDIRGAR